MRTDRLLWLVALGAFIAEVQAGLAARKARRMDVELRWLCETATR